MKLVIETAAVEEPVSVYEAKEHLRVDHDDDDALIAGQLAAARDWAETFTRRAFVTRTYELWLDRWPGFPLALPHPPLQSVTSITYYDESDNEATWAASNYLVDAYDTPGRVVLRATATMPAVTLREANGVCVTFVAGYGAVAEVPELIKAALLLIVGDLYENRENVVIGAGNSIVEVPYGARALLWPFRVEW